MSRSVRPELPASAEEREALTHLAETASSVRAEDGFDVGAVHSWLSARLDGLKSLPVVRQFTGGASNLTYLLSYPGRELILRRPPKGSKASSAHDMKREYCVQQRLRPLYRYVPEVLALCDDPAVLGSEFYVMERIQGLIPRRRMPEGVTLNEQQALLVSTRAIDALVQLHQVDPRSAGLSDLGRGAGYVERQVRGWSQRFRAARTPNVPDFEKTMAWLEGNRPDDVATCVIHNDFRLDNLVLDRADPVRVVGVLDWEMATLGDPLMDLGSALAYWVQADDDDLMQASRRQPTHLPGMLTRRQVVNHYCSRTGLLADNWVFYEVFGLFRLAVIVQQIYRRFHLGQTTNPAFADFWISVDYFDSRCRALASLG